MLLVVWQKVMTMYFVRMDMILQTNFHLSLEAPVRVQPGV
jgi:hypothetical protein